MRRTKFTTLLATLFTFAVFASTSQAMDITLRPDLSARLAALKWVYPAPIHEFEDRLDLPYPKWGSSERDVVYLSGTIVLGDFNKFTKWFDLNGKHTMDFVLNSSGGNFVEALKIGSMLKVDPTAGDPLDWNLLVLKEDKCLSACALILAMGSGNIERGATVGFHMGMLPDAKAEQSAKIRDVMDLTYDIVLEYTKLIEDGTQSPMLLREALKHRTHNSFFFLHGGMRSWALGFPSVGQGLSARTISQTGLDMGTVERICQSLGFAQYDRLTVDSQRGIDFAGDFIPVLPEASVPVRDIFGALSTDMIAASLSGTFCSLSRSEVGLISISSIDEYLPGTDTVAIECDNNQRIQGWCAISTDQTAPVTVPLLADALGCSDGQLMKDMPLDPAQQMPSWLEPPRERVGYAKRDVNIRVLPGLGTDPVDTLLKNTDVRIEDCALTDDTQGVWFKIRSDRTTGWVSARFILERAIFPVPVTN